MRKAALVIGLFIGGAFGSTVHALVLLLLWDSSPSNAADGPECFSTPIQYNICQKAREIQSQMAASLPLDVSAKVTVLKVAAFGPRLELTAIWHLTRAEINEALLTGGMTQTLLSYKAGEMTPNLVCGHSTLAGFVRQKGEIEYAYIAENGHEILNVIVRDCGKKR